MVSFYYYHFYLIIKVNISRKTQSVMDNLHILCLLTFHCASWSIFTTTCTCFIKKIYAHSSSLLQGKHLPFTPSPLRLNMFRLFVILLLTQLYRYTPEIFLFPTATFKYKYHAPLRRIGREYSAKVAFSIFQSMKRIQPLPVCAGFFICIRNSLDRPCVTMPSWSSPLKCKVSL
jgi:hypothetical protein